MAVGTREQELRIGIVGGCGRVGLPLGLALARTGALVTLYDTSRERAEQVAGGRMPFQEAGADDALARSLSDGRLQVSQAAESLESQHVVIVTIGTPVDEFLNPDVSSFDRAIRSLMPHLRQAELLILRSTVFPGVTQRLADTLAREGLCLGVAYCPERIAEGRALDELFQLPQIVSGVTPRAEERAVGVFQRLGVKILRLSPVEAELAKLFTNAYRYINFAISNQFYVLAEKFQADFYRIFEAVTTEYPRMKGFAGAGFVGGPCLFKDTMQLGAFNHNTFLLGQAAMMINEGFPSMLVESIKRTMELSSLTVGILGMAYKGNCDDPRASLSYKLRKLLMLECRRVLCSDPYIVDPAFVPVETLLREADLIFLGACHDEYRSLTFRQPVIDAFRHLPQPGRAS